jgi:N-acylneuraminate cytidylyltransferase
MSQAVKMVMDGEYDSVLSLYEDLTYLWQLNSNGTVSPVNYDPSKRGPRQLEHWNQYAENKAVYVMRRDLLMETGCRLGGRIGCVTMEKWRSIDVDKPADLMLCELIFSSMQADKNSNFSTPREIQNENTDPGCDDFQHGKFSSKIQ